MRCSVDSGATHNFIDPLIANRLRLNPINIGEFVVNIANSEKVGGGAYCKATRLVIQGN